MNYNYSEFTFPSSDGIHNITAELYAPKTATSRAVIQLSHGMIDYVGRYRELADYLTGCGFIFAGHHHLGHGKSVKDEEDYGIFSERGGTEYLIEDMHTMNRRLHESFPTLPVILMGHSMGSFIARLYTVRYPHTVAGLIIHGTGGPNPALPFGRALTALIKAVMGPRHISPMIEKLAFGSYNSKFPKSEGADAWLTRETSLVSCRSEDRFTNFKFTASGYADLFKLVAESNGKKWFKSYPKELPTLIISGDADPVGNYGKGPEYVSKKLYIEGCSEVTLKMYKDARHELFNETCRAEVFEFLARWADSVI